jgi:hypothetical protein
MNRWNTLAGLANYWASSYGEIECPGCGCKHEVDWNTEYGEPYDGKYLVECKKCNKKFDVVVETITTYTVEEIKHERLQW